MESQLEQESAPWLTSASVLLLDGKSPWELLGLL